VLIALTVAGCSSSSSPAAGPPIGRTPKAVPSLDAYNPPQPASRPTTMAGFYAQKLSWHGCHDGLQCSTLVVPEIYSKPAGTVLQIAVIRKPSSSSHQGSLIVNPGGPGGSGVQFVEEASSSFSQLTAHYDLVSFDPRGVGESDPVRCLPPQKIDTYVDANPDPTTAAGRAQLVRLSKQFANACFKRNGQYLEHVGTKDQARDMDLLRAALGDRKLTYYGASYGTFLGAKYAELFPTRIRAMVLDGALNPDESSTDENRIQAGGFETDLRDFFNACVATGKCPLGSSLSAVEAEVHGLEAALTAHPIHSNGRIFGSGEFFEGLASGLYSPEDWAEMWNALYAVEQGNPVGMFEFADSLTERNTNGTYSNLIESNMAINCIDRPAPKSVASYIANATRFAKTAPDFGAAIEYGSLPCAFWKVPPAEGLHTVSAPGAPPILVIGTTRDPATPYVWAQSLAQQLSSGVLLTYDGDGHTAYIRHDSCVDQMVSAYVLDLHPPAAGTTCH
jgi:pimeloyl-ACP methyl ester carboxylesterase